MGRGEQGALWSPSAAVAGATACPDGDPLLGGLAEKGVNFCFEDGG